MSDQYDPENDELYPEIIDPPAAQGAPQTIEVLDSEDGVLDYTQRARQMIVDNMIGRNGEKLGNLERGDKMVALAALDGMDRAALSKKRMKTDEKVNNAQAQAAAVIAQVLGARTNHSSLEEGRRATIPALPANLTEPEFVPGETAVDAPQMDVNTFMSQAG